MSFLKVLDMGLGSSPFPMDIAARFCRFFLAIVIIPFFKQSEPLTSPKLHMFLRGYLRGRPNVKSRETHHAIPSRRRQPALHHELEQVSKSEILRKLKHASAPTIRDVPFRVS